VTEEMIKEEEEVISTSLRNYNAHNLQEAIKRLQENLKINELQEAIRKMQQSIGNIDFSKNDE
jgi:hypothetical protein